MTELPTEPVQRFIGKYEQRISKLEEVNGKLCEEINRQERVIEALTAKKSECENVNVDGYFFRFECSECSHSVIVYGCKAAQDELPSYCPNCGKAVKR